MSVKGLALCTTVAAVLVLGTSGDRTQTFHVNGWGGGGGGGCGFGCVIPPETKGNIS